MISIDLTDTRQNFLGQCQHQHWQFNTLRHAQYSTMMILQARVRVRVGVGVRVKVGVGVGVGVRVRVIADPNPNPEQHIHNKPSYCLESCVRGRVEDGSFMVGS